MITKTVCDSNVIICSEDLLLLCNDLYAQPVVPSIVQALCVQLAGLERFFDHRLLVALKSHISTKVYLTQRKLMRPTCPHMRVYFESRSPDCAGYLPIRTYWAVWQGHLQDVSCHGILADVIRNWTHQRYLWPIHVVTFIPKFNCPTLGTDFKFNQKNIGNWWKGLSHDPGEVSAHESDILVNIALDPLSIEGFNVLDTLII